MPYGKDMESMSDFVQNAQKYGILMVVQLYSLHKIYLTRWQERSKI